MKNFKTEQEFLDYQIHQLNFLPNISIVTSVEYLDEILEGMTFDYEYSKEVNSDNYTYLIEKTEDSDTGEFYLYIEPILFNDNGEVEELIENDIVLVQNYY